VKSRPDTWASILTGPVAKERIVGLAQSNGSSIEQELKTLGNAGVLGRVGTPEKKWPP
jgi:hypothetical protein